MANDRLINIFDQCVTRLADGATIEDCVQLYPQYQNELRAMLTATRIPQSAQVSSNEVRYSQARVRLQFEQALIQTTTYHRSYPLQRIASILLFLLFVGSILTTGVVVAAQDSIPGDTLYGVKRLSEQIQLSIVSDKETLQEKFAQRRIDETKQVIKLKREVNVQFVGVIDEVSESAIHVSGLVIEVTEPIQTISFMEGMRVDVSAKSRLDQPLLATDISIVDLLESNSQSDEIPIVPATIENITPTAAETQTPRETPSRPISEESPTPRLTPMPTLIRPDVAKTRTSRETPSRPTVEESPTPRLTPLSTRTRSDVSATASRQCEASLPSGWIRYTIQLGDTPLGIAIGSGISLDQFLDVNCDLNPRLIRIGDVVFVPYEPRLSMPPTMFQHSTETPSGVAITPVPRRTDEPNDVRPTTISDRRGDRSSKQRDRDKGDEKVNSDSR